VSRFLPWDRQKSLKMVWHVLKDGSSSYLIGTAHFFPTSFARSMSRLIRGVNVVLTEGPLDKASMEQISEHGRQGNGKVDLKALLDPGVLEQINRLLAERISGTDDDDLFYLFHRPKIDYFEMYTRDVCPWMGLFTVWTSYLNWKYSVDLEAYQTARRMGRRILPLESLDEQLAVLEGIPLERVKRHLNDVMNWQTYRDHYVHFYLAGDLDNLVKMTDRFPTRIPTVIGERDRLMFERIQPFYIQGCAAAFVGFPHIPGIRQLLLDAGYTVTQGFE
jgi:hypothetical protein